METTGDRVKKAIRAIPPGRVASYGALAAMAGLGNGARTVARILHACSAADGLAWWRVVKADGSIALAPGYGREEQLARLAEEGVEAGASGRIDMGRYAWNGGAA